MAIKVNLEVYKNNPAATFWSQLGVVLSYVSAVACFFLIFGGLLITDGHVIFMTLWVIGSIALGIVCVILVNKFCSKMVDKAIEKKKQEIIKNLLEGR